ncbi:hypothetical protein Clacol_005935 [Clathrus columnatus]|uniref:Uncharacterized protein n=1 Tax=Clathrus columnatus TaxID=1419009 RepID=A0AAV5AAR2_9AGAM|nr:hypothetical protein Clacol_005935 [Clathrus columnatus]
MAVNAIPLTGSNFFNVVGIGQFDPADAAIILDEMTTLQSQTIQTITAFTARKNVVEGALSGFGLFLINNFKTLIDDMATAMQNAAPVSVLSVIARINKANLVS